MDENTSTVPHRNEMNAESLDEVVKTTRPHLWVALLAILAVLAVILAWAFLALIPVSVTVPGVIQAPEGRQVASSPVEGSVTLSVVEQQPVQSGQALATIAPYDGSPQITLQAPFAGVVSEVDVMSGSGVAVGQSIVAVTQPSAPTSARVVAYVDPTQLATFRVGASVSVEMSPPTGATDVPVVSGQVVSISNSPASIEDMEANLVPMAAAVIFSDEAYGLLYPITIELADEPTVSEVYSGQIVTVINTYEDIRPIEAIIEGLQ